MWLFRGRVDHLFLFRLNRLNLLFYRFHVLVNRFDFLTKLTYLFRQTFGLWSQKSAGVVFL